MATKTTTYAQNKTNTFIPIVFITDDNYVIPTAVAIESLIENKDTETKYEIFIVSTCISEENTSLLKTFISETIRINIIQEDVSSLTGLHTYDNTGICQASPSALLKFKLPILLSKYNKIIYLDGDILVRKDLSNLYNINLSKYYVAAVHDTGKLYSNKAILKQIPNYFNSGVMVLNLKKCRQENMSQKLFNLKKQSTDMSLMDQNILNIGFQNQVKILDIKYNFLTVNLQRAQNKFSMSDLNLLFGSKYVSLQDIDNQACILHFASKDKPWKYIDALYSEEWYKYFQKSPYKHHNIHRVSFYNLPSTVKSKHQIIVSLTSYPARIKTVNQTIESLLNQTHKADKVILWLAPEQFPNRESDLPQQLLDLRDKGLTIDWYHDIKSYKKLIPTLQKYPDATIVTADDDLLYPNFWLNELYKNYLSEPNVVWCHRAHSIQLDGRKFIPYKQWKQNIQKSHLPAAYTNFCTTGAGVLYPPNCFYRDVLQESIFMSITPNADDIWFWAMLVLNNKKIKTVSHPMERLVCVDGTQETALWYNNVICDGNDVQLANLVKKYPKILKILLPKKKLNLKPYLLFPYYLGAVLVMKFIILPRKKKQMARQNLFEMANDYKNLKAQVRELKSSLADTRTTVKRIEGIVNQQ